MKLILTVIFRMTLRRHRCLAPGLAGREEEDAEDIFQRASALCLYAYQHLQETQNEYQPHTINTPRGTSPK